jgi:hypothetical protein
MIPSSNSSMVIHNGNSSKTSRNSSLSSPNIRLGSRHNSNNSYRSRSNPNSRCKQRLVRRTNSNNHFRSPTKRSRCNNPNLCPQRNYTSLNITNRNHHSNISMPINLFRHPSNPSSNNRPLSIPYLSPSPG